MIEQGHNDLMHMLSTFAQQMQRMCIVQTGMNRVWASGADRREWNGPPMVSNLSFAGVSLDNLPKILYRGPDMTCAEGRDLWDRCVTAMFERRNLHEVIRGVCPDLPLFERSAPLTEMLVQVLCAIWWGCGGKLTSSSMEISLEIEGDRFHLDQRTVTHGTTRTRLLRGGAISPKQCLSRPLGRSVVALPATTAVYRHMRNHFPEHVREWDVIFAAAVTGGRAFQQALTHPFDIEKVELEMDDQKLGVWSQCRRIVNSSITTPGPELWGVLKGTISYHAFVKLFGNPHATERAVYRPSTRTKHSEALDRVEGGKVNFALLDLVGDQAAEVNNLLLLQKMMGSM